MSTINVKENLAAHMAILDLLNRYTDAVNQRDWRQLESVFAEDGIWDMGGPNVGPMAMLFEGARNIAQGIAASVSTTELCVQTNHAAVVAVNGRRATARSTINELVRPKGAGGMTIAGTYYDEISLGDDGEWRFTERRFRITYVDSITPIGGQVIGNCPLK
jgi:hypothetical protein